MSGRLLRRKTLSLLFFLTLAFVVCLPMIQPFEAVNAQTQSQTQYYDRSFTWNYGGETWTWNLTIPAALYEAYISVPDSVRTQIPLSGFGYFVTTEDSYMQSLIQKINATATQQGYTTYQEINFALAFVQSIPYETDLNSTGYADYPRFPVETLVDDVGDCKSHSILFATLTEMLGVDAVFINPPDHLAVGVLGENLSGTYWTYDNQNYYYCETTGEGFTIGQLPQQFDGVGAYIYPIYTDEQYVVNLQSQTVTAPVPSYAPYNPNAPQTTANPNLTPTSSPVVAGPTEVPVEPIGANLILDNPVLFVFIIAAIGICMAAVILPMKAAARTSREQATQSSGSKTEDATLAKNKFCIYCGSSNKSVAVYCEGCGQKIGEDQA